MGLGIADEAADRLLFVQTYSAVIRESGTDVQELNPDIVILDLQMPIMNGLEAARQISRLAPNTAMLMFTLYSGEQLLKDAQAAGIKDVVSKSNGAAEHLLASLRTICAAA